MWVAPDCIWYDDTRTQNCASEHNSFFTGSMVGAAVEGLLIKPEAVREPELLPFARGGDAVVPAGRQAQTASWRFSAYAGSELRNDAETGQYPEWQFGGPMHQRGLRGVAARIRQGAYPVVPH